jgi:hypothetical protein
MAGLAPTTLLLLLPLQLGAVATAAAPLPPPPPSPACQQALDTWCNCAAHCSAGFPQYAPLAALYGLNRHNSSRAWRCYPVSELTPDRRRFVPDPSRATDHICTTKALPALVRQCSDSGHLPPSCPPPPTPPPPPGPLPRLPGVAFITRVFEGGVGGCVKYRTPSLLNVGGGTLLAFTQCRQVSHADASPQEIHMKKSLNDGRTWGPATVLPFAADPLHNSLHRAQTVFDVQSRAVFLFDDALPYPTTKPNDTNGGCIVRVWRSPDLGTSWVRTLLCCHQHLCRSRTRATIDC